MATQPLGAVLRHIRKMASAPTDLPDGELLRRFVAQGDEIAFSEMVQRHGSLVLTVCRQVLHHEQDAEDAFQATFLVLAKRAGSILKADSLASWLHGVAYRTAMKAKTNAAKRRVPMNVKKPTSPSEPASEAALRELQVVLHEEVNRLPEKVRAPFILCCMEGKSQAEAAQQLGWKGGTLGGRLAQARERLRQRLARRGVTLSAVMGTAALSSNTTSAAVTAALADATIRAAILFVKGKTIGGISTQALSLAEAVMKAMALTNLKGGTALVLAAALFATGVALATYGALPAIPAVSMPQQPPKPVAQLQDRPQSAKGKPVRTDRYGDPLPPGAVARMGTLRWRHGNRVQGLAFTPDGLALAAGSDDKTLSFWDVTNGKRIRQFTGHKGTVNCIRFSPDGKIMVTAGCFEPGEGGANNFIDIWDVASGKRLRQVKGNGNFLSSRVAMSPDGKSLAAPGTPGPPMLVYLWDVATGQKIREFQCTGVEDYSNALAFSSDGKILAAGGSKTIRLWEVTTVKQLYEVRSQGLVRFLAYSPDNKVLATAEGDGKILLLDAATGKELHQLKQHRYEVFSLAFSSDGRRLASGSRDGSLVLWDVASGQKIRQFPRSDSGDVWSVALSPDDKILACGIEGSAIELWETATGRELQAFGGHRSWVQLAVFSPDSKTVVSADLRGSVRFWEASTGKELRQVRVPYPRTFSRDGRMLVEGWKTLHLWDLVAGKEVKELQGHEQGTGAIVFSPDGKTLVTGGRDGIIQIQEVETAKILAHFPSRHMNDQVNCLTISPDGTILASGGFEPGPGPLPAAGNEHTFFAMARLWDMKTGKLLGRLQGSQLQPGNLYGVSCLAFSPDGKTLASACGYLPWTKPDTSIRLWDLASRQEYRRLQGCEGGAYALAFSPNGKTLASAGNDRSVRLWEVATGKERCRFLGHQGWVPSVAFSADGRALVSCSADTTVMVWAVMRAVSQGKDDQLSAEDLQSLWSDLAAEDAGRAYQAMCHLVAAGSQGIRLLKDRLQPDRAPDRRRLAQLFANLDSESFDTREKATRELERVGDLAGPALKKVLEGKPTPEVRRRVERLLAQLQKGTPLTPNRLRALRGIEVLEQIGSFEARQVLEGLGHGALGSQVTTEAQLAFRRLVSASNP